MGYGIADIVNRYLDLPLSSFALSLGDFGAYLCLSSERGDTLQVTWRNVMVVCNFVVEMK